MVQTKDILPAAIDGVLIAAAFIVLGLIVAFLNGLLALSVPIWTIIATVIILPLVGISSKQMNMNTLLGLGLSVAIVGIIAIIIPAASFLFTPFQTGISSVLDLIAVLLHLGAAIAITGMAKKQLKV